MMDTNDWEVVGKQEIKMKFVLLSVVLSLSTLAFAQSGEADDAEGCSAGAAAFDT